MTDPLTYALAELLNRNPGMDRRLMLAHVDDGMGRCDGCSQHNRVRWPCGVARYVARANDVRVVAPESG